MNVLMKWNSYFITKKEEYNLKREKLHKMLKELEVQKSKLSRDINNNYDTLIENFTQSKNEMVLEIEDLYMKETEQLKSIKIKIEDSLKKLALFFNTADDIKKNLSTLSNNDLLSLKMDEFKNEDDNYTKIIEELIADKTQIKFKDIKWSEDIFFNKKEVYLEEYLKNDTYERMKNHVILFGDYKDRIILNYDIDGNTWNKMEATIGGDYEFLDYSCVVQYKSDVLLITGGCMYANYKNTAVKSTYLVNIISPHQVSFMEFKQLSSERFSHGSCVIKGVVYVYGGHNGVQPLSTLEFYDEKENIWKIGANMNIDREIFAHCLVKDRYIYTFGGFNETHLDTIERYDSVQNKWRLLNVKIKRSLQNATAITLSDDQIALIGGYNGLMHKSIDILNLNQLSWSSVEVKMKIARRRAHCYKHSDKVIFL